MLKFNLNYRSNYYFIHSFKKCSVRYSEFGAISTSHYRGIELYKEAIASGTSYYIYAAESYEVFIVSHPFCNSMLLKHFLFNCVSLIEACSHNVKLS